MTSRADADQGEAGHSESHGPAFLASISYRKIDRFCLVTNVPGKPQKEQWMQILVSKEAALHKDRNRRTLLVPDHLARNLLEALLGKATTPCPCPGTSHGVVVLVLPDLAIERIEVGRYEGLTMSVLISAEDLKAALAAAGIALTPV